MNDPTPEQIEAAALAFTCETREEWERSPESYRDLIREDMRSALVAAAGAAPQKQDEKPADLSIMNGWLVESVGKHTCGAGMDGYGHEPGCGYVPMLNLAELDGYPAQVDEAKLAEFLESPTHEPADKHCAPDATCANCPVPVHELPPADLARKVAEWLRGGGQ